MEKLTLGEFRKMIEGLPDDIVIGISEHHEGHSDNWGYYSNGFDIFNAVSKNTVNLNLSKKELSIG